MDIDVRKIEAFDLDPFTVYARLRKFTPRRASYVLESRQHDAPGGRYSVVGYRVRNRSMFIQGVDAARAHADEYEPQPAPATFAAALALGAVGFVGASGASAKHGIPLHEDEGPSGDFAVGATIVLFDHQERSVIVAGPKQGNVVDRLLHEIEHGRDELLPLPSAEGEPAQIEVQVNDAVMAARVARAKPYLADEISSLVLAQTYTVPMLGADLFDVYRVLRDASDSSHTYFVDLGDMPGAPDTRLAGTAKHVVHLRRREDEATSFADAPLLHASVVGEPPLAAYRALRKLETNSRQVWGGAIGYMCPGGEAAFVLADDVVTSEAGFFWVSVGTTVRVDTEPSSVAEAARATAARGLNAVHRALSIKS
jgi:anthranilate/para-aminobenzoate synthase component I